MSMAISMAMPANYNPMNRTGGEASFEKGGAMLPNARENMAWDSGKEKSESIAQKGECQSCKNRKYQDGSDDPGVSFKAPTNVDPRTAASAVRAHEAEHVFREQFKAAQENREVIYQSVVYHSGICPECGKNYVAGGTTKTVTRGKDDSERFQVGMPDENEPGRNLSQIA